MIYWIITVYGNSNFSYREDNLNNWENWPQGVLQENTSGPAIWLILSSVIFDILHKRGLNSNMTSSISKQLLTLVGFSYVDYCDLIQSGT